MTALKFLLFLVRFQHAAARRRLEVQGLKRSKGVMFQHAAARRRLAGNQGGAGDIDDVSTRSRPKAAGTAQAIEQVSRMFQHAAARRRLDRILRMIYVE